MPTYETGRLVPKGIFLKSNSGKKEIGVRGPHSVKDLITKKLGFLVLRAQGLLKFWDFP